MHQGLIPQAEPSTGSRSRPMGLTPYWTLALQVLALT